MTMSSEVQRRAEALRDSLSGPRIAARSSSDPFEAHRGGRFFQRHEQADLGFLAFETAHTADR